MDNQRIVKLSDYSITPGARLESEGPFSGELFRNMTLIPAFDEAVASNEKLVVDLDGTLGYGTSFLEEVFGGLAREKTADLVLKTLEFISNEEDYLEEDIIEYINDVKENE